MRHLLALCFALVCSGPTAALGQSPSPSSSASYSVDPAFAAALLMAQDSAALQTSAALAPAVEVSETDRRSVRRGRRLLAAGAGLLVGSFIAGLSFGRSTECDNGSEAGGTAPIVTSALLGGVGLALTIRGGKLLASVPEPRRSYARGGGGNAGLVFGALGLGLVSIVVIAASAIPERSVCWSS